VHGLADAAAAAAQLEGVPSALAAARAGVDGLLDRGLRRTTPAATTESLLRGAAAAAQLAGSSADLTAGAGPTDGASAGALRLYGELLSLVPVIRRAPLQAFARMHALAAVEESPASRGRPRLDVDSAARLQGVAAMATASGDVPALALAAFAHAELMVHAPFRTANQLLACAVERLLLVSTGVDPRSLTVPEAGHAAAVDDYRAALAAYRGGGPEGRRRWLLHSTAALLKGVAASPLVEAPA
jgi:hypothetical protein